MTVRKARGRGKCYWADY